jgi:bacteriorhodopsin
MSVIFFSSRYEKSLKETKKLGIKKAVMNGLLMGGIYMIMFCDYGLGKVIKQVSVHLTKQFQRRRFF